MINARQPIARRFAIVDSRQVPIETVNRLRYDPAWSQAVKHLEQGLLGLRISYKEDCEKVHETDQAVKDEIKELKSQVRMLRSRLAADSASIGSDVKDEVRKLGDKVAELKNEDALEPKKKVQPSVRKHKSNKTSIQVSREFKMMLKVLKGTKSYEELIREKMNL